MFPTKLILFDIDYARRQRNCAAAVMKATDRFMPPDAMSQMDTA